MCKVKVFALTEIETVYREKNYDFVTISSGWVYDRLSTLQRLKIICNEKVAAIYDTDPVIVT